MPSKHELMRNWVQYMKNNNIVSSTVAANGELTYRRRPVKADLFKYLKTATNIPDRELIKIIFTAIRQERADREYTKPRDLGIDIWNRPAGISESVDTVRDTGRQPVSDTVIGLVFDAVSNYSPKAAPATDTVDRVMKVIRDSMLPEQRKYLWELLTNEK